MRQIADMAVNRSGETIVPVQKSIDHDQGFLLRNFNVDVAIEYIERAPDCPPLGSGAPRPRSRSPLSFQPALGCATFLGILCCGTVLPEVVEVLVLRSS